MAITPLTASIPPLTTPSSAKSVAREAAPPVVGTGETAEQVPAEVTPSSVRAAPPSREQVDRAMSEVKKALDPVARNLHFSIDDATGRTIVKVVDATTKEVIRQIPSEELLEMTRSMESFSGLFVKQKV